MGFRDGGEDVRHFQRAILSGQVKPCNGPSCSAAAMGEAVTVSDPAGNRKIVKRRDKSRDDAAVAACLAGAHVQRLLSAPSRRWAGFRAGGDMSTKHERRTIYCDEALGRFAP